MNRDEELIYLRSRIDVLERRVDELSDAAGRATDLMMRGEHMRENLMIKAICAGAFGKAKS